ncbi:MAG: hypothetical protein U0802_21140 [Candidatus Binatia bacterium]
MDWEAQPLLYHGGSNGLNVAHIWVDTAHDSDGADDQPRRREGRGRAAGAASQLYRQYLAPDAAPLPTPVVEDTPVAEAPVGKRRGFFAGDTRRGQGE